MAPLEPTEPRQQWRGPALEGPRSSNPGIAAGARFQSVNAGCRREQSVNAGCRREQSVNAGCRRKQRVNAGFTLLEVIVATAIMATAIVGLSALITQALSNAAQVREYDRAAMLARTQMNELLALDRPPLGQQMSGEIDDHTRWRATITPWEVSAGAAAGSSFLARVELEIAWDSYGQTKQVQIEGFRRVRITPEMKF